MGYSHLSTSLMPWQESPVMFGAYLGSPNIFTWATGIFLSEKGFICFLANLSSSVFLEGRVKAGWQLSGIQPKLIFINFCLKWPGQWPYRIQLLDYNLFDFNQTSHIFRSNWNQHDHWSGYFRQKFMKINFARTFTTFASFLHWYDGLI